MQPLVIPQRAEPSRADKVMRPASLVLGAVGLLVAPVVVPDADGSTIAAALILCLGFPLAVWGLTHLEGRQRRHGLELDDEGFTCRAFGFGEAQRWRWSEVSAFQAIERPHTRDGGFLRFAAPSDARIPTFRQDKLSVEVGRAEVRIAGDYDRPLEEIAAELNAARARALDLSPSAAAEALPPGAPRAAAFPQPIVFLADYQEGEPWRILYLGIGGLVLSGVNVDYLGLAWALVLMAFFFLLILAAFPLGRALFPTTPPGDNRLGLDGRGVTYRVAGKEQAWAWSEIGACRFYGRSGAWGRAFGRYLVLEVPQEPEIPRLFQKVFHLLFRRKVAVLADIYLVPLDQIAATLEAYRARAQGSAV